MEAHAFGFTLQASAPEGQKRFPISPILLRILWVFLMLLNGGRVPAVQASPLTLVEASAAVQSTLADNDLFLLTEFFGFQAEETLLYGSLNNAAGWSGTLTGTYRGQPLAVTYAGDHSAFPGGAITWTSSGSYGAAMWSSTGSAVISDRPTGFQIDYDTVLNVGGQQGSINALIEGTVDEAAITFIDTLGTLTLNSIVIPLPIKDTFRMDLFTDTILSDVERFRFVPEPPFTTIERIIVDRSTVEQFAERGFDLRNKINTVPEEPSTLLLLSSGLAVLAGYTWRQRKWSDTTVAEPNSKRGDWNETN